MIVGKFQKGSSPEFTATSLIRALESPVFPLDVEAIARDVGIIEIQDFPTHQFEGMLVSLQDKSAGFISVSKFIREATRRRFTISHELGHFLITTHANKFLCNSYDLNNYHDRSNPWEIEANQFAAELLMPMEYFSREIYNEVPSYDLIQSLTKTFGSSLTSTLIRYKDLTDESIAIVLSEDSIIKWAYSSEAFRYFIESQIKLSQDSYAIEYFRGNDLPKEFQEVDRDVWFDASNIKHHLEVRELSIPLPYYRQVLSVIWLYEDEEEIEDYEDEFDGYLKLKEKW